MTEVSETEKQLAKTIAKLRLEIIDKDNAIHSLERALETTQLRVKNLAADLEAADMEIDARIAYEVQKALDSPCESCREHIDELEDMETALEAAELRIATNYERY